MHIVRRIIGCACLLCAILLLPHALTSAKSASTTPSGIASTPQGTVNSCAAPMHIAGQEASIAQAVFQAINQSRKDQGVTVLSWCNGLANSARQHDLAMAKVNTLAHQLPGEPDPGMRESQQGITWSEAGENIGYTGEVDMNGALHLHTLMMAEKPPEDGHRQNILNGNFTIVGVDILIDTTHRLLWLTEDFAKPCC